MVARNRFIPMPMGAEIAHKSEIGFSRIPKEILLKNRHAGLYACKLGNGPRHNVVDLQETEKRFAKVRRTRRAEGVKNAKFHGHFEKVRQNVKQEKSYDRYCRGCERTNHFGCKKALDTRVIDRKPAFIPRQLKDKHNQRVKQVTKGDKIGKTNFKMSRNGNADHHEKRRAKSSMNFDAAEISVMALRQKFKMAATAFAADAMVNEHYDLDQQKKKLRLLNTLIHMCRDVSSSATKARGILISNLAWKEKEMVQANSRRLHFQRNCSIKVNEMKLRRTPLKRIIKVAHKNGKGCERKRPTFFEERAMSTEALDAEIELSAQHELSTLVEGEITNAPPPVTGPVNNVTIDQLASQPSSFTSFTNNLRSRMVFGPATPTAGTLVIEESENGENSPQMEEEDTNVPPPPELDLAESSTPLVSNSKTSISSSHESNQRSSEFFNSIDSISLAKSNSDEEFTLNSRLNPLDFVSLSPGDQPLRFEGLLPEFTDFARVIAFFNPFMNEIAAALEASQMPKLLFAAHAGATPFCH